jgi:hypothetical protein
MTLTVRLPETIESQLARFCEVMGMSKSQVVQGALRDWFAKPAAAEHHPLLAFAQASASAEPSVDWAGPYSKERLRQLVLASGAAHRVAEPVQTRKPVRNAVKRRAPKVARPSTSNAS